MVRLTSDGATKLLKKLDSEKKLLETKIERCALFVAAITEDVEKARPRFDLFSTINELSQIDKKIVMIKHAKSVFNDKIILTNGMTIGESLIHMALLEKQRRILENLVSKQPKERVNSFSRQSKDIEYQYVNYDLEGVKSLYTKVIEDISSIQQELNFLNSTETFEIDIEV